MTGADTPPPLLQRVFAGLLLCYPAEFRDEYGDDMRRDFADRLRDERRAGAGALAWLALTTALDVARTAMVQHAQVLRQDLRVAARMLRRTPGFTTAALATLALGIGATTAIASLFYGIVLRPLPYEDPDRVVVVWGENPELGVRDYPASVPDFLAWQERARSFTSMAALKTIAINITGNGSPERVSAGAVSSSFWPTLGLTFEAGHPFDARHDRVGADRVAVIGAGLWRRRFNASPSIVGQPLRLDGELHTIVGIAPQDVGFADDLDVWVPLRPDLAREERGDRQITVLARLSTGATLDTARAEMTTVATRLAGEYPETNRGWSAQVQPALDWVVGDDVRRRLMVLAAAALVLLLIGCANVANLLLARAASRQAEIAVRLAMGASRARLVRQLLTESALIGVAGGVLGTLAALLLVGIARPWLPAGTPRVAAISTSLPVLLFSFALTSVTTILFGLLPALMTSRTDVRAAVGGAGRGEVKGLRAAVRQALVVGELALATVLVVVALLLARSFGQLERVNAGFRPAQVLTAEITPPEAKYRSYEEAAAFYQRWLDELQTLPEVLDAAVTSAAPLTGVNTTMPVVPIVRPANVPDTGVQASWRIVSPGYFDSLGIPLVRGRGFEREETGDPLAIILSADLVARLWPDGQDPLGRLVELGNGNVFRVVGVAGATRHLDLAQPASPVMYFPMQAFLWPTMTVVVRTTTPPATVAGALRATLARIDPEQPLASVATLSTLVARSTARPRLQATLLTGFAGLALLLGGVGVFGLVAYTVGQRSREFALRAVLGASPRRVLGEVMAGSMRLVAMGIGVGLLAALAAGDVLSRLLFETSPRDPLVLAGTVMVLLAATVLATLIPAWRATRVDPALLLRGD